MADETPGRAAEPSRLASVAAGGGIGAAATAALAGACCLGPLAVSVLGVGGAVAAAGLAPYRPYLLGASVALLALGFWLAYRPPRLEGASCPSGSARWTKVFLWVATGTLAVSVALPLLVA